MAEKQMGAGDEESDGSKSPDRQMRDTLEGSVIAHQHSLISDRTSGNNGIGEFETKGSSLADDLSDCGLI